MKKPQAQRIRFGDFELDIRAGELRRGDARIRLQEQPFQILLMLLERPGEVITREEVRRRLWPNDTVVEFDHSIGTAIKKLRQALGDDAVDARYVETLPRRGFRFIFPEAVKIEPAEESIVQAPAAPSAPTRRHWPLAAGLIAAIVGAVIGWLVWRSTAGAKHGEELDEASLTQITTSAGLDVNPSLSPDGSALAYSSNQSGSFEIYVQSLAQGGQGVKLTSDGQDNFEPAWSPDGKSIAYHSRERNGIWVIPALGGAARRLTDFGSWPAWSPDSATVAFQSEQLKDFGQPSFAAMPPSTIWLVPAQGGTPRQITFPGIPDGGHGAPTWSPDGKRIAFSATSTSFGEIWSVPAQGGTPLWLVKGGGYDPVYGPGGRYLYFTQGWSTSWKLARIALNAEGAAAGEPELVKNTGPILYKGLRFAANGKFLAFTAMEANNNLQSVRVSPATGEGVGDPTPMTHDTNKRKTWPRFSPDGGKVAFTEEQSGAQVDVWLVDADGTNAHPLNISGTSLSLPGWFPGADRLAYLMWHDAGLQFRSFDLGTAQTALMRRFEPSDSALRLSPDGKQVAYGKLQSGAVNIWVAPLDGGPARQLTFGAGMMSFPSWSPDGKSIAFENGNEIDWIPASGGTPVQLTQNRGPSFVFDWSPDGDKVLFAGLRNNVWNVWWISRRTRKETQVTHYTEENQYVRYPAWSPRGNQIVYEHAETTGNIWLMKLK